MSRVGQLSKLYHSVPLASEETDETAERQRPSTRRETLNVYPIRSCSYGRGCTPARTAPGWGGVLRGERDGSSCGRCCRTEQASSMGLHSTYIHSIYRLGRWEREGEWGAQVISQAASAAVTKRP